METIDIIIEQENSGDRLDQFLTDYFSEKNYTKSYLQTLIKSGSITVNGNAVKNGFKLRIDNVIEVNIPEDEHLELIPEDIPIDIVYQDKDLLVINKKAGMVVHPAQGNKSGTLVNAVLHHVKDLSTINGVVRPGIVHRLDKDTSGLIIVAKTNAAHLALSNAFQEHTVKKTYLCICKGKLKKEQSTLYTKIARHPKDRKKMAVTEMGKEAITHYKVLDAGDAMSLVSVMIDTGRTHQIRVHMKHLNNPILGDGVYGKESKEFTRQMLHAYKLEFLHPITGELIQLKADIPEDFSAALKHYHLALVDTE